LICIGYVLKGDGSVIFFIGIEYLVVEQDYFSRLMIFLSLTTVILNVFSSRNKYAKRVAYLQISLIFICVFTIFKFYISMYYLNVWRYLKFWEFDDYKVGLIIVFVGGAVLCKAIKNFLTINKEKDLYI
jgi:hypothetical protein